MIAKRQLREFWEKHPDSEGSLKSWYKENSVARWNSPNDLKSVFPKASILKSGRVVFNINGNKYRLIIRINYLRQWVFIRFIGTHKDYDQVDVENV